MQNLVKTTVTIPEETLLLIKYLALQRNTSVSEIFREALREKVNLPKKEAKRKDPMRLLGRFSIGIDKIYNKRSDLYDEHIKRKMGL